MASALSLLVNDNPEQHVELLDTFTNCHIFEHQLTQQCPQLIESATEIIMDQRYDYRPDLLSYEHYGTNFWYPAILIVNKIGSILQFKSEYLNNRCLIPQKEIIINIIDSELKKGKQ